MRVVRQRVISDKAQKKIQVYRSPIRVTSIGLGVVSAGWGHPHDSQAQTEMDKWSHLVGLPPASVGQLVRPCWWKRSESLGVDSSTLWPSAWYFCHIHLWGLHNWCFSSTEQEGFPQTARKPLEITVGEGKADAQERTVWDTWLRWIINWSPLGEEMQSLHGAADCLGGLEEALVKSLQKVLLPCSTWIQGFWVWMELLHWWPLGQTGRRPFWQTVNQLKRGNLC